MPPTRRIAPVLLSLLLSGPLSAAANAADEVPDRPPNLVVILADDLGYGDLGCYGSEAHATPQIDRLAAQGMRFTDFYVTTSVCTPTRVALLTGRHPLRAKFTPLLWPTSTEEGLPQEERTLAELLRARGYVCGLSGKWHLGHGRPEHLPLAHGFDSWYGMPYPNDMGPDHPRARKIGETWPPMPMYRDNAVVEQPIDVNLLTQQYTAEAVRFIAENHHRPFFLYLAHAMPHSILGASPDFRGTSRNGLYGDAVQELDWSTGEILRVLRAFGLEQNTLVVFTSDNGAAIPNPTQSEEEQRWMHPDLTYGSNAPLRGGKQSTLEGGVRVPGIFYWPGVIPSGGVEETPAIIADVLPTFLDFAGIPAPADRVLDGRTLVPVLTGTGPREPTDFFFGGGHITGMRSGKWKLQLPQQPKWMGDLGDHPLLFDMSTDMGEQHDVSGEHPDVVRELQERLNAFVEEANAGE